MLSDRYKDEIRKAQFDFSGKYKYIALFTNPAFFVRKNLYYGIKSFAPAMKGKVLDFVVVQNLISNYLIDVQNILVVMLRLADMIIVMK